MNISTHNPKFSHQFHKTTKEPIMETSPAILTRGCMFISVMLKWNKSIQRHFSETRRPHSATARFASPQIQWLINHH